MSQLRVVILGCFTFAACGDGPTATPVRFTAPAPSSASLVPLDRFGVGQGGNGNACRAAEYRQFDFWVGNWDRA